MKVTEEQQVVETIVTDVICDKCETSCKRVCGFEYGSLYASWGYGSKQDCNEYNIQLCEDCFMSFVKQLPEKNQEPRELPIFG